MTGETFYDHLRLSAAVAEDLTLCELLIVKEVYLQMFSSFPFHLSDHCREPFMNFL